jgi:hypothetical protein
MSNTLFYSKNCEHCLTFILELKKENLLDYFDKKICIDTLTNLPDFLSEVPTILVEDYDKPISGDRAFNWVKFKLSEKMKDEDKKSGLVPFDFNNSNENYDNVNDDVEKHIGLTSENHSMLDTLDQPLMEPEMVRQLTSQLKGNNSEDSYKKLENMRRLDDTFNK